MDNVLLTFLALLAITSAAYLPQQFLNEVDKADGISSRSGIASRGIVLSSKGKKIVQNFVKQFENGYTKEEMVFQTNNSFSDIDVKIENFTVKGFDNLEINKLNIGYTLSQSVKFNFLFPKIIITGKLLTNSFIDVLHNFGMKLQIDVQGDIELIVENIIFQGYFKYTMPILFGSIKLYKFDGSIVVGNVVSRIDGILGSGALNQLFNNAVEESLLKLVNSNQDQISEMLKNDLVPLVNLKLEGSNIWTIIR